MEWKFNIEKQPNLRILIRFFPKEEKIHFISQFKPHNKEWVDFNIIIGDMNMDYDYIKETLNKSCEILYERLTVYQRLDEELKKPLKIEIKKEE